MLLKKKKSTFSPGLVSQGKEIAIITGGKKKLGKEDWNPQFPCQLKSACKEEMEIKA